MQVCKVHLAENGCTALGVKENNVKKIGILKKVSWKDNDAGNCL